MPTRSRDDVRPLDSTAQAFASWSQAERDFERARAVALATAEMKFRKANVRLARQQAMRVRPSGLAHTQDWQQLATRHFAAALEHNPTLWREMSLEEAVTILARHGYAPDAT